MDRTDRRALVLALIEALRSSGSWCGDTHIQKSCYVLQTVLGLPTGFKYILYKHGPFSFDLQEYMHGLKGDDLVAAVPTEAPYGTSVMVTAQGKQIESLRKELIDKYSKQFQLVSEKFGKKTVRDLEKIATAIYVKEELGASTTVHERAKRITQYKKHVKFEDALAAVQEAEELFSELAKC